MNLVETLRERSGSVCELCGASDALDAVVVAPKAADDVDGSILACAACRAQIDESSPMEADHWRCLNDSMWSQLPAVQVMAWRLLTRLGDLDWPQNLLGMLYLDDETLAWAKAGEGAEGEQAVVHRDSNGAVLSTGDTVTLIKDLDVKGANFVAKRGTAVRGIALVDDNAEHIEGRVSGQRIVILTKFVKKAN